MAVEVTMGRATITEGKRLLNNLRTIDRLELEASLGKDYRKTVLNGIRISREAHSVRFNGKLAAIWGVLDHDGIIPASLADKKIGIGWLLTTPTVEKYPIAFWKMSLVLMPMLLNRWDILVNEIDVRHQQALRWGSRLGFQFHEPRAKGINGELFSQFMVSKEDFYMRKGVFECALPQ